MDYGYFEELKKTFRKQKTLFKRFYRKMGKPLSSRRNIKSKEARILFGFSK